MLERRRTFYHPTAGLFDLPILVPSFSSKGFGMERRRGTRKDATNAEFCTAAHGLAAFSQFPTRSVLISAYDIHFQHFKAPGMRGTLDQLRNAGMVFLDSGGYEKSKDYDSAELRRSSYEPKPGYGMKEYRNVLRYIHAEDKTIPLVITNADWMTHGRPLSLQLKAARQLFGQYPDWATNFLIKPWKKGTPGNRRPHVNANDLSDTDYSNLAGFNIIGVTEKELGKDLSDKLKGLMSLRRNLYQAGIEAPIHLWGGLDPIMTPLFFFAGADIFDGISWLRYAFHHGVALNRECGSLLDERLGVNTGADRAQFLTSHYNLEVMENLVGTLRSWVDHGGDDFSMFDNHIRKYLQAAYLTMCTWDPSPKGSK